MALRNHIGFILVLGEFFMSAPPVTSQTALQTFQYQDYQKNILSLWWEAKEVRLRQLEQYKAALVQDPRNTTLVLAMGVLLTCLAVPESEKSSPYTDQAVGLIQEYLDQNPGNMVALAYFCTARSLVLRNNGNILEQVFQMGPILDAVDRAVASRSGQQDEWLVRLVRANLFIKLPDLLGKKDVAYRDFRFIVQARTQYPEIEMALPTTYYYLARIEQSRGNNQAARDFRMRAKEKAEALNQTSTEEYRALLGSNLHASR